MTAPDSGRAERLARQLAGWPRRRIRLRELWRLLDEADPASRGSSRRRQLLADCLDELRGTGLIELPAAASFDRTQRPALPQFVTLCAAQRPEPAAARVPVWHPALSWVATLRVTGTQARHLERINSWLFRGAGRDRPAVPLRERSLEVLGDEKALDALIGSTLFAPDRLTLELLQAYRVTVPLHVAPIGTGEVLLVVENSDTFDSLRRTLAEAPGRVGAVAWGAGGGFESSVLSVAGVGPQIREIRYFGDLDAPGLRIPAAASRLAEQEGLPAVRPATALYTALHEVGCPRRAQLPVGPQRADELVGWLDPVHREPTRLLLTSGRRIAQEAVGLSYLTATADWRDL